jgi:transcriptional regulator with XRE-family HTH domain
MHRDRTLISFGRNVARIRSERGFSQDKLVEKADLDRTFVSGIERGVIRALKRLFGSLAHLGFRSTNSVRGPHESTKLFVSLFSRRMNAASLKKFRSFIVKVRRSSRIPFVPMRHKQHHTFASPR